MNSLPVVYLYANLIPYQENIFQMCFCIKNRSIRKSNFRFLGMTLMPCSSPAATHGLRRRHGLGHKVSRVGQKKDERLSLSFQLLPPLHRPSPGARGGRWGCSPIRLTIVSLSSAPWEWGQRERPWAWASPSVEAPALPGCGCCRHNLQAGSGQRRQPEVLTLFCSLMTCQGPSLLKFLRRFYGWVNLHAWFTQTTSGYILLWNAWH